MLTWLNASRGAASLLALLLLQPRPRSPPRLSRPCTTTEGRSAARGRC